MREEVMLTRSLSGIICFEVVDIKILLLVDSS